MEAPRNRKSGLHFTCRVVWSQTTAKRKLCFTWGVPLETGSVQQWTPTVRTLPRVWLSSSSLSFHFWSPNLWLFDKTKDELPELSNVSSHAHNCTWKSKSLRYAFFFARFRTGFLINNKWVTISKESTFVKGWISVVFGHEPTYLSLIAQSFIPFLSLHFCGIGWPGVQAKWRGSTQRNNFTLCCIFMYIWE